MDRPPKTDAEHAAWLEQAAAGLDARAAHAKAAGDYLAAARYQFLAQDCRDAAARFRQLAEDAAEGERERERWHRDVEATVRRAMLRFQEIREGKWKR